MSQILSHDLLKQVALKNLAIKFNSNECKHRYAAGKQPNKSFNFSLKSCLLKYQYQLILLQSLTKKTKSPTEDPKRGRKPLPRDANGKIIGATSV